MNRATFIMKMKKMEHFPVEMQSAKSSGHRVEYTGTLHGSPLNQE